MPLNWFNSREAVAIGAALAEQWQPASSVAPPGGAMQDLLRLADREVRPLRLNFFKRAKLANSFKWKLLQKGVDKQVADELTQTLVVHLLTSSTAELPPAEVSTEAGSDARAGAGGAKYLLTRGNALFAKGNYAEALHCYERLVELKPRHAEALNNLGATLCRLDRYRDAEEFLRRAIKLRPDYAEAQMNLGAVLQCKGLFPEAEASVRRALKSKPGQIEARSLLGAALIQQGRLRDARGHLEKVLRVVPKQTEALVGMGQAATMDGRFDEAESWFKRALEVNPNLPGAWAGLAGLRKMTASDRSWLERAQQIAARKLAPTEEAAIRFAIGKYHDDTGEFSEAFKSYQLANELVKKGAEGYRRDAHAHFVDDLIKSHSRESIAAATQKASDSRRPVFVVGMLRSGTTLAEQIIASHPAAKGAGELGFWSNAGLKFEAEIRRSPLDDSLRGKLADDYLRLLNACSPDALRVVDKAPINADYLGIIHTVFPNARIIYMRRNPLDTCLSCYFQQFSNVFSYTLDLADLAHYYREHQRLMAHWRSVLPPGTLFEVRYEDLVSDQAASTRRMLEFIGLDWDERCLDFYKTERVVSTASTWQVRQRMYGRSVERWRNYEKHIGPLLSLKDLA